MDNKNFLILIFFSLLLISGVTTAVTIKAEANHYAKGEIIALNGKCGQNNINDISAVIEGIKIFEDKVICTEGEFVYNYKTTFIEPSGNWKISISDKGDESSVIVGVDLTSDSAYYRITFLSPSEFSLRKSEDAFVSIQLTDSGTPVDDAEVILYDVFGRKIMLKPEGSGIYDLNYVVPFDSESESWVLVVTAQKEDNGKLYGGERKINVEIIDSKFNFNLVEPSKEFYEQSDSIPFKLKITYPNGSSLNLENLESAVLEIEDETYPFEINSEEEFVLAYNPKSPGNKEAKIIVTDIAENKGETKIQFLVTCSVTCLIKSYGLITLVLILVVGVISRLFYAKIKLTLEKIRLKAEKQKTTLLIKDLQEEYFTKGVMPTGSYKSNLALYKAKLIELEERLKYVENRLEEEK